MKTIKLYNGVEIPQIGYGAMVAPADTERLVSEPRRRHHQDVYRLAKY